MASSVVLSRGAFPRATPLEGSGGGSASSWSGFSLAEFRCGRRGSAGEFPLRWKGSQSSFFSRDTGAQAMEETSSSGGAAGAAEEEKSGGGGCLGCGRAEILGGCNGEGRMQGGIGALPGFGWLPIKAFRPCPAFVESGGRYRRMGQSLEEVAFGRKGAQDDSDISDRLKGRS